MGNFSKLDDYSFIWIRRRSLPRWVSPACT